MKNNDNRALQVARDRVAMAKLIGWKELEESWQRDVDRLIANGGKERLAKSYPKRKKA